MLREAGLPTQEVAAIGIVLGAPCLLGVGAAGDATFTVMVVEWIVDPLVPATVNVYAPACADAGTSIEIIDDLKLPEVSVSEVGLSETVQPAGAAAVKPIVPLNPLTDAAVTVVVAE